MLKPKRYVFMIAVSLMLACLVAFGRIACNDFINYDDTVYITDNYVVQSGFNLKSLQWALTTVHHSYWHPLTWFSHMLDWQLFGANASGHHIVSLFLHIGAVIFLFLFLNKTTNRLWPSIFAAAFFALHPLRVESVAWAAERKDVLSMFFGMATLYAYAFYAVKTTLLRYLLCATLFALALMSKPMMITLPFVLILLDYWPLERFRQAMDKTVNKTNLIAGLLMEKIPFILLTVFVSIETFLGQSHIGAVWVTSSFLERSLDAIVFYVIYLGKIFWPADLAVFYPYPPSFSGWKILASGFMLLGITVAVIRSAGKLPFLFTGWLWFVGTLVPVIGFVKVGSQSLADRYTYLPSVGIAMMMAWGISYLVNNKFVKRNILLPGGAMLLIIMSALTWKQCGYWQNSIEIFNHTLRVTKNNYVAHNNMGTALFAEHRHIEAIQHFSQAIQINPDYPVAYNNRGSAYFNLGHYQSAMDDFNASIALKRDYANPYNNRALVYFRQSSNERGCDDAGKACKMGNCNALRMAKEKGYCH